MCFSQSETSNLHSCYKHSSYRRTALPSQPIRDHKVHSPYGLVHFCWSLENLLVFIYSKLHSKSCDYLYLNLIEDDWYFLGLPADMRLSTRYKIWFTLGLFANYFSLKSLSLSLKSHMNVLCALNLTELWNTSTSLLFDLNYKLGASLLALAKSTY